MPEEKPKRRLPMVPSGDDDGEDRPAWHWSAIGAVATLLAWLPLAILVGVVSRGTLSDGDEPRSRLLVVLMNLLAFGLAAAAGGYLVGRFGGRAGPRQAAVAGFAAAALAWTLAAAQPAEASPGVLGWMLILVTLGLVGAGAGLLGGRWGLHKRR